MQGNAWLPNYIKGRPVEAGSPKKDVTPAPVRSALENEEQQESPGGSWAIEGLWETQRMGVLDNYLQGDQASALPSTFPAQHRQACVWGKPSVPGKPTGCSPCDCLRNAFFQVKL